ncbi:HAD family hydrolase [Streptosporangium lutulentum]
MSEPMNSVGFDLDMTLADTRAGIAAVYDEVSRHMGVFIDSAAVVARLGPPLEWELANWLPPEEIAGAAAFFRSLYPSIAVPVTVPMPGAREAVEAVRRGGGRVVVVTGKNARDAASTVEFLGLDVDEVAARSSGPPRGSHEFRRLRLCGRSRRRHRGGAGGGVVSVAVATGLYPRGELHDHGADVVLGDLTEFTEWFDGWRTPASLV